MSPPGRMPDSVLLARVGSESEPGRVHRVSSDGRSLWCACAGWRTRTHATDCRALRLDLPDREARCSCADRPKAERTWHTCRHAREIERRVRDLGGLASVVSGIRAEGGLVAGAHLVETPAPAPPPPAPTVVGWTCDAYVGGSIRCNTENPPGRETCRRCLRPQSRRQARQRERVYILAVSQEIAARAARGVGLGPDDWRFIVDVQMLHGLHGPRYWPVESFWRRRDYAQVLDYLNAVGGREFRPDLLPPSERQPLPEPAPAAPAATVNVDWLGGGRDVILRE